MCVQPSQRREQHPLNTDKKALCQWETLYLVAAPSSTSSRATRLLQQRRSSSGPKAERRCDKYYFLHLLPDISAHKL